MRCAAMVVLGGCSLAFTSAPDTVPRDELPACTTSHAVVIADAINAVPPLAVGGYLGIAWLFGHDPYSVAGTVGLPALAVAGAFIVSAIYGEHNIGACNDAIDAVMAGLLRDAETGDCKTVIAFAKRLARRDVPTALAFVHDETFARCFN